MFNNLDPKRRRLLLLVLVAAALLVTAIVVPVVVAANYFQRLAKTEEPVSISLGNPTQTLQVTPSPTTIDPAMPSQILTVATPVNRNCTYTAAYWLNHQEFWPALISVNEFNYTKEEAILRLQEGIEEVHGYLFFELHGALLNVLSGAEAGGVKRIMDQAIQWLNAHPERRTLTELELQQGLTIAGFLRDFNNGVTGPGLCEGQSIADSTPDIATLFPTTTGVIELATTSMTATPTRSPTPPTVFVPPRTATPTRSSGSPPPAPRPTATRTNRPPQPTDPPTPVPTQEPTATQRPTQTQAPPPPPTETKMPTPTSPPQARIFMW